MLLLVALAAGLYSSVGHGGASAYLAIMALFAFLPEVMRPTALTLNLLVSSVAAIRFLRAGQFNLRLFLAFAVTAIPMAFIGGMIVLPSDVYRPLVGGVLWLAAARLLWSPVVPEGQPVAAPALWISLPAGGVIGLLAGLTGTGGGIFLSPLVLLFRWETPRHTSGVAALFILVNSAAGLAGNVSSLRSLPPILPLMLAAVAVGALLGTWLGVERLPRRRLEQALGLVLIAAGAKLLFT